jgi:hypothetical protein
MDAFTIGCKTQKHTMQIINQLYRVAPHGLAAQQQSAVVTAALAADAAAVEGSSGRRRL